MRSKNTRMIVTAGWVSVIVNLVLFALKYWAGIVSGSIAIVADAWHTLSDSVSSIIVIFGATLAGKPADDEHPFGHGRAEHIAAVIIGVLLAIIAFEFLLQSVDRLRSHTAVHYGMVAKVVTVVSILAKEGLAQYAFGVGRKAQSSVLKADGWHHRSDAFSSVGTAIGISGAIFLGEKWRVLDPIASIIVSFFIVKVAWDLANPSVKELLENSLPKKVEDEITAIIQGVSGVKACHNLRTRKIGNYFAIEVHVKVDKELSVEAAHMIATEVERQLRDKYGRQTHIGVHIEPYYERVHETVSAPLNNR